MQNAVDIEAIRAAAAPLLSALPDAAWLPHRLIRMADGKLDKPPCEGATTNRPESWFTLDAALILLGSRNNVAGIGFAITNGIIGLDYDDCRNPDTGALSDVVQAELEYFDSYAYVTPSGKGIRIVGINDPAHPIPGGKSVRFLPGGQRVEIFVGPTNFYNTFTSDTIAGYEQLKNISDNALTYLAELVDDGAGATRDTGPREPVTPTRSMEAIQAALDVIPNLRGDWEWWGCRIGMAVWRASGGSAEGLAAWIAWSARNPIHDDAACHERWEHWFRSPPTRIGYGSLVYEARQATPSFVPPLDPPPFSAAFGTGGESNDTGDEGSGTERDKAGHDGTDAPEDGGFPLSHFSGVHGSLDAADFLEGILIEGSMIVIYGESGSGKTFFATDLGLHVATGMLWRGRMIEPGGVIYCALEGAHGINNRIVAFRQYYGLDGVEVPFAIVPVTVDMRSAKGDVDRLIQTIRRMRTETGVPVRLVVIDTLSRAMAGGNENSSEDMGALVANTDKVRQATGVAIAYVHHSGKDAARGARGHSLLRAATDTEIEVSRADKDAPIVAVVTKQREIEVAGRFAFRLETVTLGMNRRGKPVTSCVVRPVDGTDGVTDEKKRRVTLTANALLGLRALGIAIDKEGAPLPPLAEYPAKPTIACSAQVWRREFYQLKDGAGAANRQGFHRAQTELLARNVITGRNGFVWRVSDE